MILSSFSLVQRVCPVCGSSVHRRAMQCATPAETLSWTDLRESWRGLFRDKSFFTYDRCDGCSLLYSPVYFSEEQLQALYGDMEANMSEVASGVLRRSQERYFRMVADLLRREGDYLELGPDVGYFTGKCAEAGEFAKFWLVEPNKAVWPTLRESVARHGVAEMLDSLDRIDGIPNKSLSFCASIHVMDHLTDPVATLRTIKTKMIPGSCIMSVTHDERSLLSRLLGPRWPAFCLQHPQIYNSRSIRSLYEKAGFEIVSVRKTTNYFPLGFLIRQGLWAVARVDAGFLRLLDGFQVGLKLGNIMAVARAI